MNQEKAALALGVAKSTFSEMENGKSAVTFERLIDWCLLLRLSPADVLGQLERREEFEVLTKERREVYYKTVDMMLKRGYSVELDTIMTTFAEILARDKQKKRIEQSKRKIKKYFPKVI